MTGTGGTDQILEVLPLASGKSEPSPSPQQKLWMQVSLEIISLFLQVINVQLSDLDITKTNLSGFKSKHYK